MRDLLNILLLCYYYFCFHSSFLCVVFLSWILILLNSLNCTCNMQHVETWRLTVISVTVALHFCMVVNLNDAAMTNCNHYHRCVDLSHNRLDEDIAQCSSLFYEHGSLIMPGLSVRDDSLITMLWFVTLGSDLQGWVMLLEKITLPHCSLGTDRVQMYLAPALGLI